MRKLFILLTALLVCSAGVNTFAQEQMQSPKPASTSETERPKTTIDKLVEEAKARGELVLVRCLQDCGDKAIDGDVETGRALDLPTPEYPAIARAAHASGQVVVQLIIDVDGTVSAAAAISGHPLLQAASVQAARNARFSVTKVNDQPVKVTGVITYTFIAQ
jgi:TonB family protein